MYTKLTSASSALATCALFCVISATLLLSSSQKVSGACSITNNKGEVIFSCKGEEDYCSGSALGKTLVCSGKEEAKLKDSYEDVKI